MWLKSRFSDFFTKSVVSFPLFALSIACYTSVSQKLVNITFFTTSCSKYNSNNKNKKKWLQKQKFKI